MRYVVARLNKEREDYAYRIYVTDSLKVIGENSAQKGGRHMNKRYIEILNQKVETRSKDAIIDSIKRKLGAL